MVSLILVFMVALAEQLAILDSPFTCQTTVRFSPKGGVEELLVKEIGQAKARIRIAIYGLNNPKVADALIAAGQKGVDIALKLDRVQSAGKNQQLQIERLRGAGIRVEVSQRSRLLHNKFMVLDGKRVWTGSYNWTTQAEDRHRENVVLLDCPEAAELYEKEWAVIEIGK